MENIEEMNEQELLREILSSQQRSAFYGRLGAAAMCVIAAAVLTAIIIFVPRSLRTLGNIDTLVADTNVVVTHAEESLQEIDTAVKNINTLVEQNTEDLTTAIESISKINFETLNNSIRELEAVTKPLSRLFSVVGGR